MKPLAILTLFCLGLPSMATAQTPASVYLHFSFQVATRLEQLLDKGEPVRTIETPVYEFPSVAVPA